jgi:hypothetical protein
VFKILHQLQRQVWRQLFFGTAKANAIEEAEKRNYREQILRPNNFQSRPIRRTLPALTPTSTFCVEGSEKKFHLYQWFVTLANFVQAIKLGKV